MDDALTTADKVKKYATEFADVDDKVIESTIADATLQMEADELPGKYQELGCRLLVCHLLFVLNMAKYGGVSSATSMGESQTMFDWSKDNDPYMEMYKDLVDRFGHSRRKGSAFTVD